MQQAERDDHLAAEVTIPAGHDPPQTIVLLNFAGVFNAEQLLIEAELDERKKTWQPVKRDLSGWLARYQKLVSNASQGGVLAI